MVCRGRTLYDGEKQMLHLFEIHPLESIALAIWTVASLVQLRARGRLLTGYLMITASIGLSITGNLRQLPSVWVLCIDSVSLLLGLSGFIFWWKSLKSLMAKNTKLDPDTRV
jgi:hypothetical protein